MVQKLLEQSLFLFGYLLVLVHVHLMVHLPPGGHTVVYSLVRVIHRERVRLSRRSHALSLCLLGVHEPVKLGIIRGSNRLSRSGHHFLIGVYVLKGCLGILKLSILLSQVDLIGVLLLHLRFERLHSD